MTVLAQIFRFRCPRSAPILVASVIASNFLARSAAFALAKSSPAPSPHAGPSHLSLTDTHSTDIIDVRCADVMVLDEA